jgi:hypothetical protein
VSGLSDDFEAAAKLDVEANARARVPQAGGSRGFLTPWKPRPTPLRGPQYKVSLGNCCVNAVWTPLTLESCGPQARAELNGMVLEEEMSETTVYPVTQVRKMPSWPRSWANFSPF